MHSSRSSRIVVGLVGVALLTAACGAQPGGAPAPPPLPGMTPVPVAGLADAPAAAGLALTAHQVSARVLAPTDVPAGWTQASEPSSEVTQAAQDGMAAAWEPATCRDLAMAGNPGAGDVTGGTQFTAPDGHVVIEVVTSWSGDPTSTLIAPMTSFTSSCPTIAITVNGTTVVEHVRAASIPQVGEHAAGYVTDAGVDGQVQGMTYQAVVTVGHVSVTLIAMGPTMLDQALLDQLVTTAVARVQAAA